MKNLITIVASTILLLLCLVQFTTNQALHIKMTKIDRCIDNFKEDIRQTGYISEKVENTLKEEIALIAECDASDVKVSGTSNIVYRVINHNDSFREKGKIYYNIEVPIKNVISGAHIWGINEEDTNSIYRVERVTTSEVLRRE